MADILRSHHGVNCYVAYCTSFAARDWLLLSGMENSHSVILAGVGGASSVFMAWSPSLAGMSEPQINHAKSILRNGHSIFCLLAGCHNGYKTLSAQMLETAN